MFPEPSGSWTYEEQKYHQRSDADTGKEERKKNQALSSPNFQSHPNRNEMISDPGGVSLWKSDSQQGQKSKD